MAGKRHRTRTATDAGRVRFGTETGQCGAVRADGPAKAAGRSIGRRQVLRGAAVGGITGLGGCIGALGQSGATSEPLRIGVLAPNPRRDPMGASMVRSAEIAAREHTANGGIGGREVEVVVGNTNASPLEARRVYQRLTLEADVDVTVGFVESTALEAVIDDIAAQETLHFTTGATPKTVTDRVKDRYDEYKYHFRTMLNDFQVVHVQLSFLEEMAPELGWESVATLAEDYAWAEALAGRYESGLPELETVHTEHYQPETDDFTDIYDAVADAGADVAWVGMAHTGTDAVLDWANQQREFAFGGIHVPMQAPSYYETVGGACRYGITQTSMTADAVFTETADRFVDTYRSRYDGDLPVYTGYLTYDAINAYARAVDLASSFADDDLVAELETAEMETTMGRYAFQGKDDIYPHDPAMSIDAEDAAPSIFFQWQEDDDGNGVQKAIWPKRFSEEGAYVPPSRA